MKRVIFSLLLVGCLSGCSRQKVVSDDPASVLARLETIQKLQGEQIDLLQRQLDEVLAAQEELNAQLRTQEVVRTTSQYRPTLRAVIGSRSGCDCTPPFGVIAIMESRKHQLAELRRRVQLIEIELPPRKKKEPNQALEPTSVLGTSAAEPPRVPSTLVAHL